MRLPWVSRGSHEPPSAAPYFPDIHPCITNDRDTVGEFAGLAESSTYAGKSARIAASIRTETGSVSFLAQLYPCPSLLNYNAKYKRLLPPFVISPTVSDRYLDTHGHGAPDL